jgi:hypothetical protein
MKNLIEYGKSALWFAAMGLVVFGMIQCTEEENAAREKHRAHIQKIKNECELVRVEIIDMSHRQKMYRCDNGAEYVIPEYGYER